MFERFDRKGWDVRLWRLVLVKDALYPWKGEEGGKEVIP